MIYGIIGALDEEVALVKEKMTVVEEHTLYGRTFYTGSIGEKNIVLVWCGVGKVNAARTTQILIDNYKLDYIINVGTAGGLKEDIEIGDVVIADKLVQHDFDITAGGHEKGYISHLGKYFYSNKDLINKTENVMESLDENFNTFIGTIATGDIFVQDVDVRNKIKEEFEPACTEMEGAAIAQVCTLDNMPFVVIRAISDKPNGNNGIDFETYLEMACERYAKFIDIFLK